MVIAASSEEALSQWMGKHLSVAIHPHDDRGSLEGLEQQLLSCSTRRSICVTCSQRHCVNA